MREAFADPEFPKEFHKLMGDDPAPLGGEELVVCLTLFVLYPRQP